MFKKEKLHEGVTLYTRKSEQFKTITVSFKWKTELNEKIAAHRAVLSNVLQDSNGKYRTQGAWRKALDELYGTVFFMDSGKRGNTHIVSLNLECVNDEYLSESGVFNQALDLIKTAILEPNLTDGKFDEAVVGREKRMVIERIRSVYDDKGRFAQKRLFDLMRPDDPASISSNGTEEEVNSITNEVLLSAYEKMLNEDELDIYVVGDIDEQELLSKLRSLFSFKDRQPVKEDYTIAEVKKADERTVFEKQDMKQGKLLLGFNTPVTFDHKDYAKMQITNGILGGFAHSKLFMNVREKESMAYTVNSAYAAYYGIVYVLAGIDAELEEKAVDLIKKQVRDMAEGNVTDKELDQTIAMLTNSIRSAFDSARGQIEIYDQYKILSEDFNADQLIRQWEAVTISDVKEMASQINLELIYLLSGREA